MLPIITNNKYIYRFCKPHFKQLFKSKGNYSEGFGQLKPQQQHELKKGSSTSAFVVS